MKRSLLRFTFSLFFLALRAFNSSLAFDEVITYDYDNYDNAGQMNIVT